MVLDRYTVRAATADFSSRRLRVGSFKLRRLAQPNPPIIYSRFIVAEKYRRINLSSKCEELYMLEHAEIYYNNRN